MAVDEQTQNMSRYLLVSDSNEMGNKYDSKKMDQNVLVDMAQDNMFRRNLDMSRYVTTQEYATYLEQLEKIPSTHPEFDEWKGKFRVVDGQVILLRAEEVDRQGKSPLEYLYEHWHITPDYRVMAIQECMLRGMTNVEHREQIQLANNTEVPVSEENLPPHMHHSGIDMANGLQTMTGVDGNKVGSMNQEIRYDMFYNESFSTGLDRNELDGVVDEFNVQMSGNATDENTLYHNNMPVHDRFYAFAIQKTTV